MKKVIEILGNISLAHWVILSAATLVLLSYKWLLNIVWLLRKDKKLLENRKKPIMIVRPSDKDKQKNSCDLPLDMINEYELLSDCNLFTVNKPITPDRVATHIGDHGLIIVGYCKDMDGFASVLHTAISKQIPIIVYTFGYNQVTTPDMEELKKYPWHAMSNFPLRLVSEVFTTLSTFNYKKSNKGGK